MVGVLYIKFLIMWLVVIFLIKKIRMKGVVLKWLLNIDEIILWFLKVLGMFFLGLFYKIEVVL